MSEQINRRGKATACNWLLVTRHRVAFLKRMRHRVTQGRKEGESAPSLFMCGGEKRNPAADSKHSAGTCDYGARQRERERFEQEVPAERGSEGSAASAHWDETGLCRGRTKGPNVSRRRERPVISSQGGSPKHEGRQTEGRRRQDGRSPAVRKGFQPV